jgi:hypothetical protein
MTRFSDKNTKKIKKRVRRPRICVFLEYEKNDTICPYVGHRMCL